MKMTYSQLKNTVSERLLSTVRWSTAPEKPQSIPAAGKYDFVAKDFLDLADQMGV